MGGDLAPEKSGRNEVFGPLKSPLMPSSFFQSDQFERGHVPESFGQCPLNITKVNASMSFGPIIHQDVVVGQ